MYREHMAVLIGGIVILVLRMGDLLLKWVATKLGVEELPEKPRQTKKRPSHPSDRDTNDKS